MRTLDFVSLRLFAVVIEHGNIAQASRVNGIAASAISKRISDLEDQMGVALIHRQRDGIKPTAAGQVLYEHVRGINSAVDRLQADLSEFTTGNGGAFGSGPTARLSRNSCPKTSRAMSINALRFALNCARIRAPPLSRRSRTARPTSEYFQVTSGKPSLSSGSIVETR